MFWENLSKIHLLTRALALRRATPVPHKIRINTILATDTGSAMKILMSIQTGRQQDENLRSSDVDPLSQDNIP